MFPVLFCSSYQIFVQLISCVFLMFVFCFYIFIVLYVLICFSCFCFIDLMILFHLFLISVCFYGLQMLFLGSTCELDLLLHLLLSSLLKPKTLIWLAFNMCMFTYVFQVLLKFFLCVLRPYWYWISGENADIDIRE